MINFLLAFFSTNLIEFFSFHFLIKKPFNEKIFSLVLINSITLPAFWILFPFFFDYYFMAFIVFELSIIVIEAFLIRFLLKQSLKNSFLVSFSMNLLSAGIGFIFF